MNSHSTRMVEELTRDLLAAVCAEDKTATFEGVRACERALPPGPSPLRLRLRAVECSADIANWVLAHQQVRDVVALIEGLSYPLAG